MKSLLIAIYVLLISASAMANCKKAAEIEADAKKSGCANTVDAVKLLRSSNGQEVYRIELGSSEDDGDERTVADSYIFEFNAGTCQKISEKSLGGACN